MPGMVMTLFMMATVAFIASRNNWGGDVLFAWKELGTSGIELVVVFLFPMTICLLTLTLAGVSVNYAVGGHGCAAAG